MFCGRIPHLWQFKHLELRHHALLCFAGLEEGFEFSGANYLTVSRSFFESVEWWKLVPDQSVLTSGASSGNTLNVAMRSADNDRIVVYLSSAATVSIDLGKIASAATSSAWWMDPKTGDRREIGDFKNEGSKVFSTPEGWKDALLVVE